MCFPVSAEDLPAEPALWSGSKLGLDFFEKLGKLVYRKRAANFYQFDGAAGASFNRSQGDIREDSIIEMAQNTKRSINELLVSLFNHVMDMEARAVITEEYRDITNNDMHIIEAIGVEEPRNMSQIAHRLAVTVGTLTTNMNGLERKGYIRRERSEKDKRVVYILLTEKGRKAFYHHRDFHKKMIKAIVKDLNEEEMEILYRCLVNLDRFLEPETMLS